MCMARLREIVPGVTGHGAPNGAHGIINPNTSGPLLHSLPTFNYDDIMRTSCSNQAGLRCFSPCRHPPAVGPHNRTIDVKRPATSLPHRKNRGFGSRVSPAC